MELTEENKINTPFFQIDESDANDIRAALNTEYENVKWKTDIHNTTLNNTELYKRAQEEDKLRRNAIDSNTESKDFSNVFKDLLTDTHIKSSEPQNTKIVTPPQYSDLADYKKLTKYQQKKTSDSQDERNRNALLDLQAERTENTPYVNSLKNRIIITQLSIDTKFRKNYFSTNAYDYTINLATPLKNVISMRLASMEIPNVQQVVSATAGTNAMVVSHSGFNKIISIPSGNYEYWLLADVLNAPVDPTEGNTSQTYIGGGLNDFDLHVSIDQATQKTTIKSIKRSTDGVDLPVDFVLDFTNRVDENAPPMKTLGWILGFRKRKYEGAKSYTSEAAVDLAGSRYMFLCVNDFQSSVHEVVTALYENSFLRKNILARIPVREAKGVVLFDDCTDRITKKRHYFGPCNINKLHISVIDEYGCAIDLLGIDYSFALEFQILYEK